jgi:hypothetical protein
MKRTSAKADADKLYSAYAKAMVVFNAASASLIVNLAANTRPTDAQIAAEEKARAVVVAARRKLWAAHERAKNCASGRPRGGRSKQAL